MEKKVRVIDTGHLSAAENMALDEAMLEARQEDRIPDTIRFLSFRPPAALVGYFQTVEKEIRVNYCQKKGIDINRRITGGGALYWSSADIGWEIFSVKGRFQASGMESYYGLFCSAVARGINQLGIHARFRPRNDIEVGGKKISGSGGTCLQDAFLFQGTLLVDLDIDTMLRCLRVPVEKLSYREISSLKQRITWLAREVGYRPARSRIIAHILNGLQKNLGIDCYHGSLLPLEKEKLAQKLPQFRSKTHIYRIREKDSQHYIAGMAKSEKSVIRCWANMDTRRGMLKNLYFTGDYFLYPPRAVFDLEALLKNMPASAAQVKKRVHHFFDTYPQKIAGLGPREIIRAVEDCFAKAEMRKWGIPQHYVNDLYLVGGPFLPQRKMEALLLPYCAKLPRCEFRYSQGCTHCGQCSIQQALEIAQRYGVPAITIVSFEHLMETLARLKKEGAGYYGGCCCEAFYQKHQQDFESIPLPGILMNIGSSTCYDLGKEEDAYQGRFEGFTQIKVGLLQTILQLSTGGGHDCM